jgi:hypothetical protein
VWPSSPVAACVPRFEMRGLPLLTRCVPGGTTTAGAGAHVPWQRLFAADRRLPALRLHVLAAIGERPRVFSLWNFQIPRQSENTPVCKRYSE